MNKFLDRKLESNFSSKAFAYMDLMYSTNSLFTQWISTSQVSFSLQRAVHEALAAFTFVAFLLLTV